MDLVICIVDVVLFMFMVEGLEVVLFKCEYVFFKGVVVLFGGYIYVCIDVDVCDVVCCVLLDKIGIVVFYLE